VRVKKGAGSFPLTSILSLGGERKIKENLFHRAEQTSMLINPRNVQAVARKEFYHIIRDYRSLYMAFALPLLLILLFGYALSLDVDNVKVVIVDQDRTELSRDFAGSLDASAYFDLVTYLPDERAAVAWLDAGKATIALVIPPRWTENIRSNREAPLQVLIDASDPNIGTISGAISRPSSSGTIRDCSSTSSAARASTTFARPWKGASGSGSTRSSRAATSSSPASLPSSS